MPRNEHGLGTKPEPPSILTTEELDYQDRLKAPAESIMDQPEAKPQPKPKPKPKPEPAPAKGRKQTRALRAQGCRGPGQAGRADLRLRLSGGRLPQSRDGRGVG